MTKKEKAIEIIQAARQILSEPESWTKDELAKDSSGYSCDAESNDAECFCLAGALYRSAIDLGYIGSNTDEHDNEEEWEIINEEIVKLFQDNFPKHKQITDLMTTLNRDFIEYVGYNDLDATEHHHIIQLLDRTLERNQI